MSVDAYSELQQQIHFLLEIDRLKCVVRQSRLADGSRRENSAEHSWHLAMFATTLCQHAEGETNVCRVVQLLLLHDVIEIDAGDTPIHSSNRSKSELAAAEAQAARRIFGLLPTGQARQFEALWHEFEAGETNEARFAKALDRLQPLLLNVAVGGGTWSENGVREEQVIERYGPTIKAGSPSLWDAAQELVRGHFSRQT
ncbi:HD domain-containing protein [Bradyrhizobium sp. SZCCHNRI2049]|uniref:HD domain-containing protein n=1 Tax=Bradyrhizobium sp. SZCCHNRI2049 TaxID=3057287 RepID=UPI0029167E81|nr:HD domain-containing protein [Bradyrhizobium sp. SZCCHNRI2049]